MILLPLPYDVEKVIHNLMGLVMGKDEYKVRYGEKFSKTTMPAIHDKDISNNATNVVLAKAKSTRPK